MSDRKGAEDIDALWEYGDPDVSEERFRDALIGARGDERLELLTQIARTYSLRGRFDGAHAQLDEVEGQLENAGPRPRVRYLLERGRTFNSSGQKDKATALFSRAWDEAMAAELTGLAVDAAHMLAIVGSGTAAGMEWNERGLRIARETADPKAHALIPAMLNNGAWELHGLGRFAEALSWFQQAEAEWIARAKPEQIQIAKWSVARCLRSLGRNGEALAMQQELEAQHNAAGTTDGYVFEEIAENLEAMGDMAGATPYFGRAYDFLASELGSAEAEQARLERLKSRAGRS